MHLLTISCNSSFSLTVVFWTPSLADSEGCSIHFRRHGTIGIYAPNATYATKLALATVIQDFHA